MPTAQPTLEEALAAAEKAHEAAYKANKALFKLARTQAAELEARTVNDPLWKRMPGKGERCRVSNYSRRTLYTLIERGLVRVRRPAGHGASTFYSGRDVLAYIDSREPEP